MSTYYLNAGSMAPDGLTPDTGYHTMKNLIDNITLVDNDIVEFVDNGVIDDSNTVPFFLFNVSLTLQSYAGNINKPQWGIPGNGFQATLIFQGPTSIALYDLKIDGNFSGIRFDAGNFGHPTPGMNFTISRCHFYGCYIQADSTGDLTATITNSIFVKLYEDALYYISLFGWGDHSNQIAVYINNNTFYQGYGAIDVGWDYDGLVLNNIFSYQTHSCVNLHTDPITSFLIDYNVTFDTGSGNDFEGRALNFLGSNNLRNTDPLLANPDQGLPNGDNFTLSDGSPCITAGIGFNFQPKIPLDDHIIGLRSATVPDIGAYIYSPAFSGIPRSGFTPLLVNFTDLTTGSISWNWDFGDSSPNDTSTDPTHTYIPLGTKTVLLTVNNGHFLVTYLKTNYINVLSPPITHFNDCLLGSLSNINYAVLNNCALLTPPSESTLTNCQTGWSQPTAPTWDGTRSLFENTILAAGVHIPPEPGIGYPSYVDYETGLWGTGRIGIGAVDFTIFYANINNNYDDAPFMIGANHLGLQDDPFSFDELVLHSSANPLGNTYNIKGIRSINSNSDIMLNVNMNIWQNWEPVNGPWRIGNIGTGNLIVGQLTVDSLIKDSILYAVNNIQSVAKAVNTLFIGTNIILAGDSSIIACTFFGNLQN